jgi:hypothetical protein
MKSTYCTCDEPEPLDCPVHAPKYRKGECPMCGDWKGIITTGSELDRCPICLGIYLP